MAEVILRLRGLIQGNSIMPQNSKKLYKYIDPNYIFNVFNLADAITLKCSLPRDFNDPYELFLTIDFNERPDALAYYADAIGELPQLPTTCFSRSPIVIPMWAHYASNHRGFVVEFDEAELVKSLPNSRLDEITYSDTPSADLSDLLYRAYEIGKPRYTYFLRQGVFNAAYFTKATCWTYEQECRLASEISDTRQADSLTVLDVPNNCISSIICGPRASEETKQQLSEKAKEMEWKYFELRIGKSSALPYFVDMNDHPFSFDATEISASHQYCSACYEPLATAADTCCWCQIDDELRTHVASRNPFRILDHFALLDNYVAGMDGVVEEKK